MASATLSPTVAAHTGQMQQSKMIILPCLKKKFIPSNFVPKCESEQFA